MLQLNVDLLHAQRVNAQSVLMHAEWEVWDSIYQGSGSGAAQAGHGTSTSHRLQSSRCARGFNSLAIEHYIYLGSMYSCM
jgi:hypothetical protein